MSLCTLIYSKIRRNTSVDMIQIAIVGQIVIVGNEFYPSLSLLARQPLLMLLELPGMVTVLERIFQLEYSESCKMHVITCMVMQE